jgi:hypothetical protein
MEQKTRVCYKIEVMSKNFISGGHRGVGEGGVVGGVSGGIMILSPNQEEPSTPYTHHHMTIQHLSV